MSRVYIGSYVILGSTEDAFYGYGYNSLDKYDRYIYSRLYNAMSNYETKFDVPFMNVSYQRLYRIFICINYDNPLMFQAPLSFGSWSGNKKDIRSIKLNYDFSKEKTEFYVNKTEKRAEEILKKLTVLKRLSTIFLLSTMRYLKMLSMIIRLRATDHMKRSVCLIWEAAYVNRIQEHISICASA